jgi:hypothetical protein
VRLVVYPLDSSTWSSVCDLAHIVFHSLCAKPLEPSGNARCLKNGLLEFILKNNGLAAICAFAHNFVHKNCGEASSAKMPMLLRELPIF